MVRKKVKKQRKPKGPKKPNAQEVLLGWSASKLIAFYACSRYGMCLYALKIPFLTNPYTYLGQFIHYMFKRLMTPHKTTKRYPYRTQKLYHGAAKGTWWIKIRKKRGFGGYNKGEVVEVLWKSTAQQAVFFKLGWKYLRTFHRTFAKLRKVSKKNRTIWLAEKPFKLDWLGLTVRGFVDLIGIEPDGAVIYDYKPSFFPEHLVENDIQLTLYQLAYELCIRKDIPGHPPLKALRIYNYKRGEFQDIPLRGPKEFGLLAYLLTEAAVYVKGVLIGKVPDPEVISDFLFFNRNDLIAGDSTAKLPRGSHCTYCGYLKQCRDWEHGLSSPIRVLFWEKYEKDREEYQPSQIQFELGLTNPLIKQTTDLLALKDFTAKVSKQLALEPTL